MMESDVEGTPESAGPSASDAAPQASPAPACDSSTCETHATEVPQDSLQQVGQAMITAASAVRKGAEDARVKAQQLAPAVTQSVGKAVYATCYYLSYGIVFPTVFVASLVPMDNPIGYGIVDGATAAKEAVSDMRARRKARRESTSSAGPEGLALAPS